MAGDAVYIVDDDAGVRDSLCFLARSAGYEAQGFDDPLSLLETAPQLEPGVVVTDVRMPQMDGLELVRRLRMLNADHPVIVITGHGEVALAVEALRLGVSDFLEKPFEEDGFLRSISRAMESRPRTAASDPAERRRCEALFSTLTEREHEVMQRVVAGTINKVIAYDLGISVRTVEIYRANVMRKAGARSLSDLVRMAMLTEG